MTISDPILEALAVEVAVIRKATTSQLSDGLLAFGKIWHPTDDQIGVANLIIAELTDRHPELSDAVDEYVERTGRPIYSTAVLSAVISGALRKGLVAR